jgi:hypothetical protein
MYKGQSIQHKVNKEELFIVSGNFFHTYCIARFRTGVCIARARVSACLASPFDCDTYDYFEF